MLSEAGLRDIPERGLQRQRALLHDILEVIQPLKEDLSVEGQLAPLAQCAVADAFHRVRELANGSTDRLDTATFAAEHALRAVQEACRDVESRRKVAEEADTDILRAREESVQHIPPGQNDWVRGQLTRLEAVIGVAQAEMHQLEQRAKTAETEVGLLRESAQREQLSMQRQLDDSRNQLSHALEVVAALTAQLGSAATPSKVDGGSPVSSLTRSGHPSPLLIRSEAASASAARSNSEAIRRGATPALELDLEREITEDDAVACAQAMLRSIANLQSVCSRDPNRSATTEELLDDAGWAETGRSDGCMRGQSTAISASNNAKVDFMLVSSAAWRQMTSELEMMREHAIRLQSDVDAFQQAFELIRHGVAEASELCQLQGVAEATNVLSVLEINFELSQKLVERESQIQRLQAELREADSRRISELSNAKPKPPRQFASRR